MVTARKVCKRILFCIVPIVVAYLCRLLLMWYDLPYLVCFGGECTLCKAGSSPCLTRLPGVKTEETQPPPSPKYNAKLKRTVQHRLAERALKSEPFTILFVGPNEFVKEPAVFEKLFEDKLSQTQIVLVEPQLHVHPEIKRNAAMVNFSDVKVVQAAVATSDNSSERFPNMWWYETTCLDKALANLPNTTQASLKEGASMWATFNKRRLQGYVRHFHVQNLRKIAGVSRDEWQEVIDAMWKCIEPLVVPTLTVSQLLTAAGLQANSVDMLVVDAEGYDIPIVNVFLAQPGLTPVVLQWEWTGYSNCCNAAMALDLMSEMAKRGYDVHQDHQDFVGMLADEWLKPV